MEVTCSVVDRTVVLVVVFAVEEIASTIGVVLVPDEVTSDCCVVVPVKSVVRADGDVITVDVVVGVSATVEVTETDDAVSVVLGSNDNRVVVYDVVAVSGNVVLLVVDNTCVVVISFSTGKFVVVECMVVLY